MNSIIYTLSSLNMYDVYIIQYAVNKNMKYKKKLNHINPKKNDLLNKFDIIKLLFYIQKNWKIKVPTVIYWNSSNSGDLKL